MSNNLRSQALDLLRFPLALVVLTIHVFSSEGIQIKGTDISFESYNFFIEVNHWIDAFLRGQSVPIYYFISGYVFFLGVEMTRDTYRRKFKNRIKTLVIPYFVWNLLYIVSIFVITYNPVFRSFTVEKGMGLDFSIENVLSCFWIYNGELFFHVMKTIPTNPINVPLWFVRDLIIVVLCTPFLHWLIKKFKYYFIIALGIVWFFIPYLDITTYGFEMAFFFFSWGAYMSINKIDMLEEFGRFFKVSVYGYILLGLIHVWSAHNYPEATSTIKQINVLVGLFFAYNVAAWLLKKGICKPKKFLASASFFIYVSHWIVYDRMTKLLMIIFSPDSSLGLLFVYTSSVVCSVGLLLLTYYLLKRYTPKVFGVMTGGK